MHLFSVIFVSSWGCEFTVNTLIPIEAIKRQGVVGLSIYTWAQRPGQLLRLVRRRRRHTHNVVVVTETRNKKGETRVYVSRMWKKWGKEEESIAGSRLHHVLLAPGREWLGLPLDCQRRGEAKHVVWPTGLVICACMGRVSDYFELDSWGGRWYWFSTNKHLPDNRAPPKGWLPTTEPVDWTLM